MEHGTFDPVTGRWHLDEIPPHHEFADLTLTVTIDAGTAGHTLTTTAQVAHVDQVDPVSENDTFELPVTISAVELMVSISSSTRYTSEGRDFTFQVHVRNYGVNAAHNVVAQVPLVPEVAYLSHTINQGSYDPISGTWTIGTLPPGERVHLDINVRTQPDTVGIRMVQPNRLIASDEVNLGGPNEAGIAVYVVNTSLAVHASVSVAYPTAGGSDYYGVGVTNDSDYPTEGIVVLDQLPDGVTYVSHYANQGEYDPVTGVWTVGTVSAGKRASLHIDVRIDDDALGRLITNTASITGSNLNDDNPANDTDSVTILVGATDLGLTMTTNQPTPSEGEIVTFNIIARSNDYHTTTGIQIEDILPDGLTFSSYTTSSGTYDDSTGIWSIDSIAGKGSAQLGLSASVDAGTDQMVFTNTVSILSADQPDYDTSNDTASVVVAVGGRNLRPHDGRQRHDRRRGRYAGLYPAPDFESSRALFERGRRGYFAPRPGVRIRPARRMAATILRPACGRWRPTPARQKPLCRSPPRWRQAPPASTSPTPP